ncbi:MAG: hypothetical protein PV340_02255 [Wolbachia sp.]|nr:hypothetical protein [Wolbachia sp.]MDD9336576.1 hypothetical protein [Wolbachia sp.]
MKDIRIEKSMVDLQKIAKEIGGFSGAGLERLVNEVKLYVVGRTKTKNTVELTMDDFDNVLKKLKSEIQKPKNLGIKMWSR